ncbi:MAG: PH domain-containing protein, partial [Aureliella sp.]
HLTRNLLQRWMGLATISLQTASGSAQAELTIEGILETDELRDFLYARMRGARDERRQPQPADDHSTEESVALAATLPSQRTLQTLIEIRDALGVLVARQGAKS